MKHTHKTFLFAALATLAGACVVDVEELNAPVPEPGDDGRLVTLSIAVPGPAGTRAQMSEKDEGLVSEVDVLLFDEDDNFCYWAIGSSVDNGTGTDPIKSFSVRLPTEDWTVVVLANARGAITNSKYAKDPDKVLVPATLVSSPAISRADILDNIVIELGSKTPWPETRRIPMWGYYKGTLSVSEGTTTIADPIPLTRAIARVDVSVADAPVAGGKFYMTDVYLCNYNIKGSVAPKVDNGTGNADGYDGDQWNEVSTPLPAKMMAVGPNVPTGTSPVTGKANFIAYTVDIAYKHAFAREIYTFEAEAGAKGDKDNPCLVIGGKYKANAADADDTAVETYYRVDFVDGPGEPLALLRNHNYKVMIQEVNGHGYPTPGEAYENSPANIVVSIVPWNEGGLDDVTFNGQHYLAVDKSEIVFYAGANPAPKSLKTITNFPGGWELDMNGIGWLTPTPTSGDADAQATITLTPNTTGTDGFFYIVAGNLRKKITVRQSAETEFSLEVDPLELVFYARQKTSRWASIIPVPAPGSDYTLTFTTTGDVTNWAKFPSAYANPVELRPADRTPLSGDTYYGAILVTLKKTADNESVTKVINVRQLNRDMEFHAYPTPYPAAGGNDLRFPLMSEGPWRLEPADPDTGLALLDPIEGGTLFHDPVSSFSYPFSLTPNPGYAQREFTINVDLDKLNLGKYFTIVQDAEELYLNITDPVDDVNPSKHEIDFDDNPGAPRTVTFKTNADWMFYSDDGNFSRVIANVTREGDQIGEYVQQDGPGSPAGEVVPTVSFVPKPPVADGMKISTIVIFSTTNHGDATEVTRDVKFTRTFEVGLHGPFTIKEDEGGPDCPDGWEHAEDSPQVGYKIKMVNGTPLLDAQYKIWEANKSVISFRWDLYEIKDGLVFKNEGGYDSSPVDNAYVLCER
jgi:hypothetical protein